MKKYKVSDLLSAIENALYEINTIMECLKYENDIYKSLDSINNDLDDLMLDINSEYYDDLDTEYIDLGDN